VSTEWICFRDLDALVDSDTKFHEQLIDVSGRRRLMDAVDRHRYLLEAVESGNVGRLRLVIRQHDLQVAQVQWLA